MTRKLKVENTGGRFCGGDRPMIRLKGKWMLAAGFTPGQFIELAVVSPGVMELRVCSPRQIDPECFRVMGELDAARGKGAL